MAERVISNNAMSHSIIAEVINLIVFLMFLYIVPIVRECKKLRLNTDVSEEELAEIKKKAQEQESGLIKKIFNNENQINFQERIYKGIEYAIQRHDWYEDQRIRIFQTILGVTGLAVTYISFALQSGINLLCDPVTLMFTAGIAVISVNRAILLYNGNLDGDYPHRQVSDVRLWYYKYNLPHDSSNLHKAKCVYTNARHLLFKRKKYFQRILDNETSGAVREDIEQLFILHLLQMYKQESLRKLRYTLSCCTFFVLTSVFLCFLGI